MASQKKLQPSGYALWAGSGDVNAFFGLMLDNIAGLVLLVGLLNHVFGMPIDFVLGAMVPGTALGVFLGDLFFFFLALRLVHTTGRRDITAMPLGLDTPSTFGMVFFVLGPAFLAAKNGGLEPEAAARQAWHIGIWAVVFCGLLKAVVSPLSHAVRRAVPRAGLLGSLAAIAIVLISFLPLVDMMRYPLVSLVSLSLLLTTLVGHVKFPGNLPGALGTLLVAGTLFYILRYIGLDNYQADPNATIDPLLWPTEWLTALSGNWLADFKLALPYLPVVIPFSLATVVGGIDCTESAAAAGDEYSTGKIVFGEAMATLLAGLLGAVIQTTPYIGHPAYKAMGGRSAYVLATALAIGLAGISGAFTYFYQWIPQPAVYPILVFVGLEIAAQCFIATPQRHYSAVAFACVPALAFLAISFPSQIFGDPALMKAGVDWEQLAGDELRHKISILRMLSAGFILTSLMWASILAAIVDHQLKRAAVLLCLCAGATFIGIIHSPLPNSPLGVPLPLSEYWSAIVLPVRWHAAVLEYVGGYLLSAAMLVGWEVWRARKNKNPIDNQAISDPKAADKSHGAVY